MTSKKKLLDFYLNIIAWMLLGFEFLLGFVLIIRMFLVKMVPLKYMIPFFLIFLIINGTMIYFRCKKKGTVAVIIFSIIIALPEIYGTLAFTKMDSTFRKLSANATTTSAFAVVVLKEDSASQISDIAGATVGYANSSKQMNEAKEKLKASVSKLDMKEYETDSDVAKALLSGEMRVAFMEESFLPLVAEEEGMEEFTEDGKIKIIGRITIETENQSGRGEVLGDKDTFVVYISGIDMYGDVKAKSRSDVNILAFINRKTGKIQLISTPRDYYVQCPWHNNEYDKLTNCGLYGIECSEDTLEQLYGNTFKIDYYLRMNFSGFIKIIDELGGVDVENEREFTSVDGYHYDKGNLHLNGTEALHFARERKAFAAGDIMRAKHQMVVIKAMISKMTSTKILTNYSNILDAVADSFQTNMPSETMYALVNDQLDRNIKWQTESYTLEGEGARSTEAYSQKGRSTYVMMQDAEKIAYAKQLFEAVLKGE